MPAGIVARWVDAKGFGFIVDAVDGRELFAHHSEILNAPLGRARRLLPGERVTYVEAAGPQGPHARRIRIWGVERGS